MQPWWHMSCIVKDFFLKVTVVCASSCTKYLVFRSTAYWRNRLILSPNTYDVFFRGKKDKCGVKREKALVNQGRQNLKFFWNYDLSSDKMD